MIISNYSLEDSDEHDCVVTILKWYPRAVATEDLRLPSIAPDHIKWKRHFLSRRAWVSTGECAPMIYLRKQQEPSTSASVHRADSIWATKLTASNCPDMRTFFEHLIALSTKWTEKRETARGLPALHFFTKHSQPEFHRLGIQTLTALNLPRSLSGRILSCSVRSILTMPSLSSMLIRVPVLSRSSPLITFTWDTKKRAFELDALAIVLKDFTWVTKVGRVYIATKPKNSKPGAKEHQFHCSPLSSPWIPWVKITHLSNHNKLHSLCPTWPAPRRWCYCC